MQRLHPNPRAEYVRKLDRSRPQHLHGNELPHWDETVFYKLTPREIDRLCYAAKELHLLVLDTIEQLIEEDRLGCLGLPEIFQSLIHESWGQDHWGLYGRLDFAFNEEGTPKLIEYNADTPTGLVEASLWQWEWLLETHPDGDQFNWIQEALTGRWGALRKRHDISFLHLASADHPEDRANTDYIARLAELAGIRTEIISTADMRWNSKARRFFDFENRPIDFLFKLYPWEWMAQKNFGPFLTWAPTHFIEPAWKAAISSKRLMAELWRQHPHHPNLLPTWTEEPYDKTFVRKPYFGNEGVDVTIVDEGQVMDYREGPRPDLPHIYQELCSFEPEPHVFAQVGVWMAGSEPCGVGIREDTRPIIGTTSRFIPHLIED